METCARRRKWIVVKEEGLEIKTTGKRVQITGKRDTEHETKTDSVTPASASTAGSAAPSRRANDRHPEAAVCTGGEDRDLERRIEVVARRLRRSTSSARGSDGWMS
jgi:hypothetical protein